MIKVVNQQLVNLRSNFEALQTSAIRIQKERNHAQACLKDAEREIRRRVEAHEKLDRKYRRTMRLLKEAKKDLAAQTRKKKL